MSVLQNNRELTDKEMDKFKKILNEVLQKITKVSTDTIIVEIAESLKIPVEGDPDLDAPRRLNDAIKRNESVENTFEDLANQLKKIDKSILSVDVFTIWDLYFDYYTFYEPQKTYLQDYLSKLQHTTLLDNRGTTTQILTYPNFKGNFTFYMRAMQKPWDDFNDLIKRIKKKIKDFRDEHYDGCDNYTGLPYFPEHVQRKGNLEALGGGSQNKKKKKRIGVTPVKASPIGVFVSEGKAIDANDKPVAVRDGYNMIDYFFEPMDLDNNEVLDDIEDSASESEDDEESTTKDDEESTTTKQKKKRVSPTLVSTLP